MLRKIALLGILATYGCGTPPEVAPVDPHIGPDAMSLETAMEVVWDEQLGMSHKPRPTITWWTPCGGVPVVSYAGSCSSNTVRPNGTIDLQWFGKFSYQAIFAWALWDYRGYVLYGDSTRIPSADSVILKAAQNALLAADM